jgi:hypothetical protein
MQNVYDATGFSDQDPLNWPHTEQLTITTTGEHCRCNENSITDRSLSANSMCHLAAGWTRTTAG